VTGDTIFNVLKMAELETDANDRPTFLPKILATTVLKNPYDDIVPRITAEEKRIQLERIHQAQQEEALRKAKKPKKYPRLCMGDKCRVKALLSFDDEPEEDIVGGRGIQSSHDVLHDKRLAKESALSVEQLVAQDACLCLLKSQRVETTGRNEAQGA
jgi:peptidyl-prolyl cis-trans isomerase SDCCAG10